MKAYFTRKPMTIDDVRTNAIWAIREWNDPVEVNPIATVTLTPAQYKAFWESPLEDRDYFATYADDSTFTEEGADCVILECEGEISLPVCLEGFSYARYVGWPSELV